MNPSRTIKESDVCINGMFLNYASYFRAPENGLESIIDFILSQNMKDGGFNCRFNRSGAFHSSLHSTLSVLEGLEEFLKNNYSYRKEEVRQAKSSAVEFILKHQLFISDRTGEIINKNFVKFHFPFRWYYDILRALDYFQYSATPWDDRMKPALDMLLAKRLKEGSWKLAARYPGLSHFEMEKPGTSSRWITLRALRVLQNYS